MRWAITGLVLALGRLAWGAATPSAIAERIARLDARLVATEQQLAAVNEAIADNADRWARAQSEQVALRLRQQRVRAQLSRRLGALARHSAQTPAPLSRSARDVAQWVWRRRLLAAIAEHDQRLWQHNEQIACRLQDALRTQDETRLALGQRRAQKRRLRDGLAQQRRQSHEAWLALRRQKNAGPALAQWREQGEQTLRAAASLPGPAQGGWPVPGQLPWPATGRVRERFGDQVELAFGTTTRHHGLRIAAPAGSRVQAVAPGQVVFADWLRGFGRTVIVAHPGDWHTVHAHLHRLHVRPNEAVAREALLGTVGDSGTLKGSGLYFELRHKGEPLDPLGYLAPAAG